MGSAITRAGRRAAASLRSRTEQFCDDREGIAAVEFAMVLPFLVLTYFGLTGVTIGVNIDRKVTLLSRSLADLTGRRPAMTDTEIENIFNVSREVLQPYDFSKATVSISSIIVRQRPNSTDLEGRVCWTETPGGAVTSSGQVVNVPAGFRTAGTSYIMAQATFEYTPIVGHTITGTINLEERTPWPVRNVQEVVYTGLRTFKDIELGRAASGKCLT